MPSVISLPTTIMRRNAGATKSSSDGVYLFLFLAWRGGLKEAHVTLMARVAAVGWRGDGQAGAS